MSAPVRDHVDEHALQTPTMFPPTMYAPPLARDAAVDAADTALAATEQLRRALPPAPQLNAAAARGRRREFAPFEGDVAIRRLRERSSLDPVAVPEPPPRERGSVAFVLLRLCGAVGVAALAALLVVGGMPLSLQGAVNAAGEGVKPLWAQVFGASVVREPPANAARRAPVEQMAKPAPVEELVSAPVSLNERFTAAAPLPDPPAVSAALPPAQPPRAADAPASLAPPVRTLDRGEIAMLYKRGEDLIAQGDIAAARLMFERAAEVGDARSALALGASYDPDVLKKLGVLGVAADAGRAREWYAKASEFGSGEAARRIELLAQGR